MGFFSTIKAATANPAKTSTKVTSWLTKTASTVTNAVKNAATTIVKGVASTIASAAEAAKKKAAAEAAAKSAAAAAAAAQRQSGSGSGGSSGGGSGSGGGSKASDLISWGSSRFFVTPTWVRSFSSLQITSSTATEDERDLSRVRFSLPLFRAYARGFLSACGKALTKTEIDTLPLAAELMTLEVGLRFLTDHLNGDTYFSISRENHNLDRCRTQFKLLSEMEAQEEEMNRIVLETYRSL